MKTVMILIVLTMSLWSEFTRSGDIVTDTTTGLQWEDDDNVSARDSFDTFHHLKSHLWGNALDYCERLELGGYHDWRLPNVNELSLLLEHQDKFSNGTEYDTLQSTTQHKRFFWTSTSSLNRNNSKGKAYAVDTFYTLDIALLDKTSALSLRCVRGGN